jgi:hypothetical protein
MKGIFFGTAAAAGRSPIRGHSRCAPSGPAPGCRRGGDRRSAWSAYKFRCRLRVQQGVAGRRAGVGGQAREPPTRPSMGWRTRLPMRCTPGARHSQELPGGLGVSGSAAATCLSAPGTRAGGSRCATSTAGSGWRSRRRASPPLARGVTLSGRWRQPGQSVASVFTNERRIAGGSPGGEIALGASEGTALTSSSPSRPVHASSLEARLTFLSYGPLSDMASDKMSEIRHLP